MLRFVFLFLLFLVPFGALASEADTLRNHAVQLSQEHESYQTSEAKTNTIAPSEKKQKRIVSRLKKYKIVRKAFKLLRKIKEKADYEILGYFIVALGTIIWGLASMGASVWLIIGVLLGIFIYLIFAIAIFVQYIDNGFELEWYWWLSLLALLGLGIFGSFYFLGTSAVSYAIIQLLVYITIGVAAIELLIILFVSLFRIFSSPFRRKY